MSDVKWSEWIEWNGGNCPISWSSRECPVSSLFEHQVKLRCGEVSSGRAPDQWRWSHYMIPTDIVAYRYKIQEPESGISEIDEEECIQLAYERMNDESVPTSIKQLRYQDAKGEDWIDEFARTASVDEFRGAMKFTIGKYNRRAGKKDELIKEIEKMRDYCDRWIDYERSL